MATNDIGRVTPIWRGFYSAATTYELNDIVIDTAGSVWWHKSEELTTGVIPEAGEIWDAVIDMSVFSALIQAAITTAQTAVQAAQEAETGVAEDVQRAETAAQSAEASAEAASESAAGVGALAQAAEQAKNAAQTAASQAAASASSAGTSATSAGSSAQAAETSKTAAQTAATQAAGSAETASGAAAVVEQKKAEALAAIETKGEEVLESIPEDYTELSGDVGDLQTQLDDISESETVTSKNLFDPNAPGVIPDHYLDTTGNPTELAGWNISDFIDVSELSSIVASVWRADETYYSYGKLSFLHTYNANKTHIAKIWDVSTDGIYTVGTNVSFIKFCWQPGNELYNNRTMMIESGTEHSAEYEAWFAPYDKTTLKPEAIGDGSVAEEKLSAELQQKINAIAPPETADISCWGDSLTYGVNSNVPTSPKIGEVTYPSRLATLTGLSAANIGMPGANSDDISGLQGGMPIYLDPFTLPADTSSVQVTLRDANGDSNYIGLLHWMPRQGWPNPLFNMGLTWKIGDLPVNMIYSGGVMKVARLEAADSPIEFTRPVRIEPVHTYAKTQIQIYFVGTNDAPSTQDKAERLCRIIQNMVAYYGGSRYLVIGMTKKEYADATNAILAYTFGRRYVDVKDYMIRYGLSDNDLTPTEQDTTDINNGVIPVSLRSDYVHFNDAGYTALANCIYQHGQMLGYWA